MAPSNPACLRDPAVFGALYRQEARAVRLAALAVVRDPMLADDVTQEVFLHLWRHPERWDPDRGNSAVYLRVLAKSRAMDALRAAGASRRALARAASGAGSAGPLGADEAGAVASRAALRAAVAELPPSQREAVALTFWGDLTSSEIARRCGVPHGTAKARVRLGLKKLRGAIAVAIVAHGGLVDGVAVFAG